MSANDEGGLEGQVTWELIGPDGKVKRSGTAFNIITDVGDSVYATNGCGGGTVTALAKPTGMKLGTGSTAVAKNGAGAGIVTYLPNSQQAFDGGFPSGVSNAGAGYVVTYKVSFAAGKATTATAIAEAVIVNETLTDAAGAGASATVSRVLLNVGPKGASDTLAVTWTHTLKGS